MSITFIHPFIHVKHKVDIRSKLQTTHLLSASKLLPTMCVFFPLNRMNGGRQT